ncbi:MAG: hypothetical protein ACYS1B_17495, partial [Planctomycetota bacterium]
MNDCGATIFNDFTHLGYPSTYLLDLPELLHIFNSIDLKYANSPKNFWIVELADGILQRETEMLLASPDVKSRIHRLVFNASDALGCVGGLTVLREHFGLEPDATRSQYSTTWSEICDRSRNCSCSGSGTAARDTAPWVGVA